MEWGPIVRATLTNKARFGLIAVQIAATLAIVSNCVVLLLEARGKLTISSGLDDEHLVSISLHNPIPKSRGDAERDAWMQRTSEELRRISGVSSLSLSGFRPWICNWRHMLKAAESNAEMTPIGSCNVDELLPETIGLTLDEGRWYSHDEVHGATSNLVITRSLAQKLFGAGPVVGKSVQNFGGDFSTIIGVIQDPQRIDPMLELQAEDGDKRCGVFFPHVSFSRVVVRIESGKTDEVLRRIEQVLESRNLVGESAVDTFAAIRDKFFSKQRMMLAIMGVLAILLLFIASVGIAGITSFSITERTRQIGIRRALGATTTDILRYFLTECGLVTTLGLVIGSLLAVLLNMAVLRIYDSAKLSAAVVGGCALLLWFVALGAAFPPALRASRISPAIATRNV